MQLILFILFVLLFTAMMCRSLVHNLLHHYDEVDKKFNLNDAWFDPKISWLNKYATKWTIKVGSRIIRLKTPVQISDAFHFFNTLELGCYNGIISLLIVSWLQLYWWTGIIIFCIIGILMTIFFNFGYNRVWR